MTDSRDPSDITFPDDEPASAGASSNHGREPGSDDDAPMPDGSVSFYRMPPAEDDLREDSREEIPTDLGPVDLSEDERVFDTRPISQRASARQAPPGGGVTNETWFEGLNAERTN